MRTWHLRPSPRTPDHVGARGQAIRATGTSTPRSCSWFDEAVSACVRPRHLGKAEKNAPKNTPANSKLNKMAGRPASTKTTTICFQMPCMGRSHSAVRLAVEFGAALPPTSRCRQTRDGSLAEKPEHSSCPGASPGRKLQCCEEFGAVGERYPQTREAAPSAKMAAGPLRLAGAAQSPNRSGRRNGVGVCADERVPVGESCRGLRDDAAGSTRVSERNPCGVVDIGSEPP